MELLSRRTALDLKYNPKDEYRTGQAAAVASLYGAIHNNYKILALDGRTGSGKSIIAATLSNLLGGADILTTMKKLQAQYIELGPEYQKVEGRGNFPCASNRTKTCDKGMCITGPDKFVCSHKPIQGGKYRAYGDKGWRSEDSDERCQYWRNVERGVNAKHTVFNYPYYVLKKNLPGCEFNRKPLQILDEGHNLESYLREVNSFSIHDLGLYHVRYIHGVDFKDYPEFDQVPMGEIKNLNSAVKWLEQLNEVVTLRIGDTDIARKSGQDGLKRRAQMLNTLGDRTTTLYNSYKENPGNWVIHLDPDGFKMIPLAIGSYIKNTLMRHSEISLIMSATLPRKEVLCNRLGLDPSEVFYYTMASTFPKEKAPIYSYSQPTMNWEKGGMDRKRDTMGKMISGLLLRYPDHRGLILCNSFAEVAHYTKYIQSMMPDEAHRVVSHNRGDNVEYLLDDHYNIPNGLIISPSLWEGEDFKDDRARFLGIAKIPFKDTKDPVVQGWMNRDKKRYFQDACQKLVQGVGRIIRSDTDWGDTHIMDGAFRRLYKFNNKEFPVDMQERVIYV
ncbi:MAG: hypothetical protein KAS66_08220 [Candidatus Omnitrophica bacterium]|nr:hypothetical protein [Candidatus Omnitrophota bacterium]